MTFGEIYEENAPAVYRCLLAWSRNAALAEDLTAETFVRALAAKQPVIAQTARAYLVMIARNLWRESLRRGWRTEALTEDPRTDRSASGEQARQLEQLLAAIAALPEHLREPLVLFAQGGLSYDEIAAQLQLPIATVKVRIFRARERLEPYR
jgi:RNA polymerase sigma-70 factor (ECF subfamily)